MSMVYSEGMALDSYFCKRQMARSHLFKASCQRCSPGMGKLQLGGHIGPLRFLIRPTKLKEIKLML